MWVGLGHIVAHLDRFMWVGPGHIVVHLDRFLLERSFLNQNLNDYSQILCCSGSYHYPITFEIDVEVDHNLFLFHSYHYPIIFEIDVEVDHNLFLFHLNMLRFFRPKLREVVLQSWGSGFLAL